VLVLLVVPVVLVLFVVPNGEELVPLPDCVPVGPLEVVVITG
jgi:hypothetical protein